MRKRNNFVTERKFLAGLIEQKVFLLYSDMDMDQQQESAVEQTISEIVKNLHPGLLKRLHGENIAYMVRDRNYIGWRDVHEEFKERRQNVGPWYCFECRRQICRLCDAWHQKKATGIGQRPGLGLGPSLDLLISQP